MKKLIQQFLKFGVVGVICFFIDFGITLLLKKLGVHYLVAAFFGFVISVTVNYILSFRFVFERKEGLDRRAEFLIFVILSAVGLVINELVMWVCVDVIYVQSAWLLVHFSETVAVAAAKVGATGVVMVYNFITRKIFLEKRDTI